MPPKKLPKNAVDPKMPRKKSGQKGGKKEAGKKKDTKKRYSMKVITEVGSMEHIEWGWRSYERRKSHKKLDRIWDGIMACQSLIQFSFTAYLAAFDPFNTHLLGFLYAMDVFDLSDICVKIVRHFKTDRRNVELRKGNSNLDGYLYSWFIVDIIGLVPTDLAILGTTLTQQLPTLAYYRCNRLCVGYKAFKYLESLEAEVGAPFILIRAMFLVVLTWILMHVVACIWYMIPCSTWSDVRDGINVCSVPSWIYSGLLTTDSIERILTLTTSYHDVPVPNINLYAKFLDTGLGRHDLVRINATTREKYFYSLYLSITTVTTVGLGEIHAITQPEMLFIIVIQLVTMIVLFGIFQGAVASMLINADEIMFRYKNRIAAIVQYLRDQNQSTELVQNVTNFYKYLWDRSKGIDTYTFYNQLPFALQSDIGLEICHQIIEKSPLLEGTPAAFLRMLSCKFRPMLALPEQIVMEKGQVSDLLVYIAHGELEVLSDDETEVPVLLLRPGKLFGEVNLITKVPRKFPVRSIAHCDLIVLKTEDLMNCLEAFPNVADELRARAEERTGAPQLDQPNQPADNTEIALRKKQQRDMAAKMNELKSEMGINLRPLMTALNIDRPQETLKISESMELFKIRDPMDEMVEYNMGSFGRRVNSRFRRIKQFLIDLSIDPEGIFYYVWERLVFVAVIVSFFLNTYIGVFVSYDQVMAELTNTGYMVLFFSYLMDIFFMLDFGFKFILQITTANGKIVNHRLMALAYLKSWGCWTDFLAVLPIEIFSLTALSDNNARYSTWTLLGFLKLNRILRILNLPRFFDKLSADLNSSINRVRVIKFATYIAILTQMSAVVMFLIACDPLRCQDDYRISWIAPPPINITVNSSASYKYTSSLYYGVSLSSGTGYGDIFPRTTAEQFVATVTMIIGTLLFGYCLSSLTATMVNNDAPRVIFQNRLFSMISYIESNKIGQGYAKRAGDSLAFLWNVNRGEDIPGVKSMMADIPQNLMEDIQVDDLIHLVSNIPLFQNVEDHVLRLFVPTMRRYFFPPNEFVIQGGDLIEALFVIRRGVCNMLHPDQPQTVISVLYPGMYFGEIGFLFNRHELVTVKSVTYCEVLALSRIEFDNIVQEVEWLQLQMNEISESRRYYEDLVRAAKEAKPYVKVRKHGSPTRAVEAPKKRSDFKEDFEIIKTSILGKYFYRILMQRTIMMDGRFLQVWEIARSTAAVVLFCLVLTQVGFQMDSFIFFGILYAFDIYAGCDIYLKLHIQYANDMQMIISHPYKTATRYLRSNFLIDFIAVFPYEMFLMFGPNAFSQDELLHWAMYLRLNRLLQIYRVPRLFNYFEDDIQKVLPGIKLLKYLTYFILFNFLWTAVPLMLECPPEQCALTQNGCYFTPMPQLSSDLSISLDIVGVEAQVNEEFLSHSASDYLQSFVSSMISRKRVRRGLADPMPPVVDQYGKVNLDTSEDCINYSYLYKEAAKVNGVMTALIIPAWYFAVTTATTTGFGDITSRNLTEQVAFCAAMICGNLFCAFIIGCIASEQTNKGVRSARFLNKLSAVKQYMHHERIPPFLKQRILRYYNFFWMRTKGDNPQGMIEGLPPSLTAELSFQLYKKVIDQIGIFKATPVSFKKMLALVLKPLFIMEGEYVIRAGDLANEIYFLFRGSVEIHQRASVTPVILRSGKMLGELAFMTGQNARSTVKARENTDLFYVSRDDFETIFDHFPELRQALLEEAMESVDRESENRKQLEPTVTKATLLPTDITLPMDDVEVGDIFHNLWNKTHRCDGPFARYWGFWMVFVRILSTIFIFYHCGFGDLRITMLIFEYILEVFIIMDFFVQRRMGYYDEYGNMILNKKMILERFQRHKLGFWMFILGIIPWEIGVFGAPNNLKVWIFAYPRIIRTIPRLMRVYVFFEKWLLELDINILAVRLTYSLTRMTLCAHFFTVVAFIVAAPLGQLNKNTWILRTTIKYGLENPIECYTTALYWVVNTITATGYGDIVAKSDSERIFSSVVQIIGKGMFALIIGDIASTLANKEIWRQSFENRFEAMKKWLVDQRVKLSTVERVQSYYEYLWNTNHGIIDIHTMLLDLPFCMRAEIAFAVHVKEIHDVTIFKKASDALVRVLSTYLRQVQFVPGDYIITQGDYVTEMYFLHRGEAVEVETGVEIGVIRHGRHINWQALLIDWPASRTVRATDNCEVYVLSRQDFDRVKENYLFELFEVCEMAAKGLTDFLLELETSPPAEEPEESITSENE